MNFLSRELRVLGLSVGEDFVILACVVFTQCQRVTDGRTDRRQTDGQTDIPIIASTGLAATLTRCKKLIFLHHKFTTAFCFLMNIASLVHQSILLLSLSILIPVYDMVET